MKRFSFKLLAVTLLVAVAAYSCIDDKFDTPPIVELPEGSVLTIQKLKELCPPGNTYKINGDSSLYAVVTMDEMSGNIYRNIFVQDNSGAANLRFGSTSGLYEGDSIRLYLKGAVLSWYNNLFQIDSLHADYNVVKQATERFVEPEVATISQINLDKDYFQSRLVKIEDVQIRASDTASIWAPYQQYGEIFIEDTDGNEMMIRTSGYAKFAGENVPNGFGSIIAIVGLYRETVQLSIRRTSEVKLDGERWIPVLSGSGSFEDPLNVAAAITNNSGTDKWVTGYIVGVYETKDENGNDLSEFKPSFEAPFYTNANILISDNPNETSLSNCLPVQLLIGTIRNVVNLVDNESNLGKEIKLRGNLESYFSIPGLKGINGYWLDGEGLNPDDDTPGELEEMSIAEIRALFQGSNVSIPAGKKVIGTVISDKDAQNIHGNNIQIVDSEGTGIALRFTAAHSFALNDKIEVNVSNASLESYNGLLQVNNVAISNATKIGTGSVEPITLTINEIKSNFEQYESRLVKIVDATITNTGGTYGGNSGNSTISDASGQMVLYTRSQASFASTSVPASPKTVVGIVSEYSTSTNPNNYQILIRNLSDIQ
ncbi:MAG: DUF5689 domain-containing protein [Bacteroidales bacterium]|nr:DUF5689 domain-containing protein [Bacteroidales bacterium]